MRAALGQGQMKLSTTLHVRCQSRRLILPTYVLSLRNWSRHFDLGLAGLGVRRCDCLVAAVSMFHLKRQGGGRGVCVLGGGGGGGGDSKFQTLTG